MADEKLGVRRVRVVAGVNERGEWVIIGEHKVADTRLAQAAIEHFDRTGSDIRNITFFEIEVPGAALGQVPT